MNRFAALPALALLAAPLPAPPPPAASPYPTPAETRAELERVCRRLREGDGAYFGQGPLADLERRLAAARDSNDPRARAALLRAVAVERFRLGRTREALAAVEGALELREAAKLTPEQGLDLLSLKALVHLRLAEEENCVERHTAQSCIFPIRGGGVHARPEQSRLAGDLYLEALKRRPGDVSARWLLHVARMTSGDFPQGVPEPLRLPPEALAAPAGFPHWEEIASGLGLDARDLAGGAVIDDFDGDGLLDVVTSTMDPCGPMKAWRNDGRGGFEDVTARWGLDGQLGGLNLVHADYDNDGRPDLLVLRGGWLGDEGRVRNSLLRNDLAREAGRFVDVTAAAGLAYPAYPTQAAAWADYDGDGDLDLFVGNEAPSDRAATLRLDAELGAPYPSQLFRNNGDGTFTDVARAAGVQNHRFVKGAAWGDYDDDGDPDLYVSNIGPNRLYRNDGDGTFTDVAVEAGVAEPSGLSFATWFFDFDNDGDLDLFVADYRAPMDAVFASYLGLEGTDGHPVLYRNDGGRFRDVSLEMGLRRPLLPMGANYGDLDNDGFPDLYLGTGIPDFEALMPNAMYRNDGGKRFVEVTFAGGFGHLQKGHGVAFGDLDNDGDQDLYEQMGGAYPYDAYGNVLYRNPTSGRSPNAWITLRLEGKEANRSGLGARIEVVVREGEARRSIHALAGTGGSFGGSSLQQEIGLGTIDAVESVTLRWPGSGTVQTFRKVEPNRFYRVVEGNPELTVLEVPRIELGGGEGAPHRH
jgi:hypothetical protein